MLKPEGEKKSGCSWMLIWRKLSALMIFSWQMAEWYVQYYGHWAWKLFKAQYVSELQIKKEPLDPPPNPVRGVVHC